MSDIQMSDEFVRQLRENSSLVVQEGIEDADSIVDFALDNLRGEAVLEWRVLSGLHDYKALRKAVYARCYQCM